MAKTIARTPTDGETAAYWVTLMDANRALLTDPADPDLLYSGQMLVRPPTS